MQTLELNKPVALPSEREVQQEIVALNSRLLFLRRLKKLIQEEPDHSQGRFESPEVKGVAR